MDNGSAPDSRQQLIKCLDELYHAEGYTLLHEGRPGTLPHVGLLLLDDNRGYARGNNAGIELCYGDDDITHIMVLNNDILFVEDIIPPLLSRAATINDCGIISPLLFKRDMQGIDFNCARMNVTVGQLIAKNLFHYLRRLRGKDELQANPRRYPLLNRDKVDDMLLEVELPSGSCMLIDKELMKEIGDLTRAHSFTMRKTSSTKNYSAGESTTISTPPALYPSRRCHHITDALAQQDYCISRHRQRAILC